MRALTLPSLHGGRVLDKPIFPYILGNPNFHYRFKSPVICSCPETDYHLRPPIIFLKHCPSVCILVLQICPFH
jgi:hypothetical protein